MYSIQNFKYPSYRRFFAYALLFSFCNAILFQVILLPMFSEIHAGLGLLKGDAILFHEAALDISRGIQSNGWSEWELYKSGFTGNVTILSVLYAIGGPHPILFLPIVVSLHALSATLIYRIGYRLTLNNTGRFAGLISGIFFTIFPSSLQWYAQIHKDSFAIAGMLILLEAWIAIAAGNKEKMAWLTLLLSFCSGVLGSLLIGLVRPFFVFNIALGLVGSFVFVFLIKLVSKCYSTKAFILEFLFVFIILAIGVGFTNLSIPSSEGIYSNSKITKAFDWEPTKSIPEWMDVKIKRAAELRVHFVEFNLNVGAKSNIDSDKLPNTATEVAAYLPRAALVGLFSPFPNTWNELLSPIRVVGIIETCIGYVFFLGFFIVFTRYKNIALLSCFIFSLIMITTLAFIFPNVGTLYRQRYGFWHVFLLIGAVGWTDFLLKFFTYPNQHSKNED